MSDGGGRQKSEAEKKAEELWKQEDRKKKSGNDGGLGHDELRDRWLERYPDMAFGQGEWRGYANGVWQPVEEQEFEAQVADVLEGSRAEGVKLTRPLLSSVSKLCQLAAFVPRDRWNADPNVVILGNGALEIATRNFREHRKEDYVTMKLPYDFDPDEDCPIFRAVLQNAVPDCVEFIQEFVGYCLTPNTSEEAALWLKGPRGSGKSTVIEALAAMLGPKHGILGLGEIEMSRFALGRIPGKTLLTSTEQPASYLRSTHVVDALISGETLTVERKHRDAEEITPTAKIIWAMNDLPRIGNTTSGIFRRVKIVAFPELQGEKDTSIKEFVKQERAGILNWALDGLARFRQRGGFDYPASVLSATETFQESNDLPAQFVEEMCETGPELKTSTRHLYEKYAEWCKDGGHKPASINRVAEDWQRLGFSHKKTKTGRYWVGVEYKGLVI